MRRLVLALALLLGAMGQGQSAWAQSGVGGGGQSNVSGGSSSSSSGASNGTFGTVIDPMTTANGGLKATVKEVFDATFTNLSTTVTTPGTDVACTSADVGTIVFGTNDSPGQGHINANVIVPQGTVQSCTAHSIVVSVAATNNCTPSGGVGCRLLWGGTDQTTALTTAWTNAVTGTGICPVIQYPNGLFFVSANPFTLAITCRDSNTGPTTTGLVHRGWGRYNSQFVILPSFNWSTCTSGASGQNCFGAATGVQWVDIGFTGGGNALVGGTHNVNIMELQTDGLADHVMCEGIGANDTAMVGLRFGAVGEGANYPIFDGCGGLGMEAAASAGIWEGFFGDSVGVTRAGNLVCGMNVPSGSIVDSNFSGFGPCGTGSSYGVTNLGTWNSTQDQCLLYFPINVGCMGLGANSITKLSQWRNPLGTFAADSPIQFISATANLYISQSTITIGAGGTGILCFTNGKVWDQGGNTIVNTGGTITSCPATNVFGSSSSATSPVVAANLVPSANWGTSAAVSAVVGNVNSFSFTLTNGSAAVGASPTIAFTFPSAFWVTPTSCSIWQVGGTQAVTATTVFLAPSAVSTTTGTFTYNGTPTINLTEFYQGSCGN